MLHRILASRNSKPGNQLVLHNLTEQRAGSEVKCVVGSMFPRNHFLIWWARVQARVSFWVMVGVMVDISGYGCD